MMMPETAKEQLLVLLKQESTVYRTYDYLRSNAFGSFSTSPSQEQRAEPNGVKKRRLMPPSSDPANDSVTKDETKKEAAMKPDWRFKMIEWAYKVVDHFDLNREIVFIATNYLDRCLASMAIDDIGKGELQLLTLSCLYLAIKLNEASAIRICGAKSTMESLLRLARARFSVDQMMRMEYDVLQRLQWRMHPPTPQAFAEYFAPILYPSNPRLLRDQALYLIELAALDYYFVEYKPSEIALAASLNASQAVYPEGLARSMHHRVFDDLVDPNDPRVLQCQNRLTLLLQESEASMVCGEQNRCRVSSPVSVASSFR